MTRSTSLFLLPCLLLVGMKTRAQSLSPSVIAAAGGSSTAGGITLSHTIGETVVTTLDAGDLRLTQGFQQAEPARLKLNIRAFLQGPFDPVSGMMTDSLRRDGIVPLQEPYTALGFTHIAGGGESTTTTVLAATGSDAVVDWVFLELRDATDNTAVLATRCALLQRDGDVVETDGVSSVHFAAPTGAYYISVQHRNHLGVLTLSAVTLSSAPTAIDLADGSTATYGTDAQKTVGAVRMLWAGDVNSDGTIMYTNAGNDRDPILIAIGGVVPTNTVTGYRNTDVNMDGVTKYTGDVNDRDIILQNIGGVIPTNVREGQLP